VLASSCGEAIGFCIHSLDLRRGLGQAGDVGNVGVGRGDGGQGDAACGYVADAYPKGRVHEDTICYAAQAKA